MLKAALLLLIMGLLYLIVRPVVGDALVAAILTGLFFVMLAPLVFDRARSTKYGPKRVRRVG
jgi:hypothetical protein